MRSIESEGDSIDQAIGNALQALRIERDRVEIEILSDATRGLFGFGGRKARVRATVRAPLASSVASEGRDVTRETSPAIDDARLGADPATGRTMDDALTVRSIAVLRSILAHLGVSGTVDSRPGDEPATLVLEVAGDSGGLLIGRRGQTLDALEYLVNRIAARDEAPGATRVLVDVEGYRGRRQQYLSALAERLAHKVRQSGRVVTLNPMSPRDRRVVHLALQKMPDVGTRSQGEGYYRRVTIVPAAKDRPGVRPNRPGR